MAVIISLFVVSLNNSSDSFLTGCAKTLAGGRIEHAMDALLADLREAPRTAVSIETRGLPTGQCAIAIPTARDSNGTFHLTSDYRPDWQGVVVYCPYETDAGVRQLRRYVVYDGSLTFPIHFREPDPIQENEIRLRSEGTPFSIDRATGNTELETGREFLVACVGLTAFSVALGSPTTVTLEATVTARGETVLAEEDTAYVAHRN
jgi:hypothetical protein